MSSFRYKTIFKKEREEREAEKQRLKGNIIVNHQVASLVPLKFEVEKLQREVDEARSECVEVLNHQRYDEIEVIENKIADADQELVDLQHESRNISIKLNKQSKRLKEKFMTINMMVQNQEENKYFTSVLTFRNSKGKIIMKEASKDSGLTSFYERMRGIINSK